jgi:Protein of unknown function (DUF935)
MADDVKTAAVYREPAIPVGSSYTKVATVKEIIRGLDAGLIYEAALLVEQMLWNPRLRGVLETRLNGLMSTAIRWEPARDTPAARRAAQAIVEDWPQIADQPTRKQFHEWGLMLGICPAQKVWYRCGSTGREIPRLQVFHPQWLHWNWTRRTYGIQTQEAGIVEAPSPSLTTGDDPIVDPWVFHEPFGQHSWRRGLVHAAWYAWLGHEWSARDQSRASEKLGIGILKARYPFGTAKTDETRQFIRGLRNVNSEGVVPCGETQDGRKYDAEPLEFTGSGFDMILRTKDSKAVDLAVLFLGHNLTTEAKGGSYAAANIGDLIRGDIKAFDAYAEAATYRRQVLSPWAERNFGDPDLAPIAVYETDPPAVNLTAAQTLQQLSQAAASLAKNNPDVDLGALFDRFRVPRHTTTAAKAATAQPAAHPATSTPQPDAQATTPTTAATPHTESATASATLAITATDLASIVRVNEGRKSVGLPPVDQLVGDKWIREHGAELASKLPAPDTQAPPPDQAPPDDTQPTPDGGAP